MSRQNVVSCVIVNLKRGIDLKFKFYHDSKIIGQLSLEKRRPILEIILQTRQICPLIWFSGLTHFWSFELWNNEFPTKNCKFTIKF